MVEEKYLAALEQTLNLLDTSCQAALELLRLYSADCQSDASQLLSDLRSVICTVRTAYEPMRPQLEQAYIAEMLENAEDTLDDIQYAMERGFAGRAVMKIEYQLFPFLRQLREAFYFWGAVCPDREKMARYYRDEFAQHYQNYYVQSDSAALHLSIVIPAFNHLETTKLCVEQMLKETDFEKLNAELVFIDHGSADGTLEYFESLQIGKVIHFKNNVRMNMFPLMFQICQGKYLAYVSNDILVTQDWAEILIKCLDSDPRIIAAVPTTPNISNMQMLRSPTDDPEEFITWASKQNRSDPSRWNDRARLMPPMGIYRVDAVNKIGFADPYFYSMEFWDDDFSLRARRAGYRQLVCEDAACYHFGSVTGKAAQQKEGTLAYGRELFLKKNGVDAWGSGFCYDFTAVQIFKQVIGSPPKCDILGLDCGMGDTPLQFKNELRHLHRECELFQLTSSEAYLIDIKPHSAQALFTPELPEGIHKSFGKRQFHFVYLGRGMEHYEYFSELLAAISNRLMPQGALVFSSTNPFFAPVLHSLLQFSVPEGRCTLADPEKIRSEAEKHFSQVQMFPIENFVGGLEEFAKHYFGKSNQLAQIIKQLGISRYYFLCRK